jgi:hypothetical protein
MSDKIECKELAKNRAYLLRIGGVEFSALKLEGFKVTQLAGTVSPTNLGLSGSKVEGDDWLILVKDADNIVMPYGVWVRKVAKAIESASGSSVKTIGVYKPLWIPDPNRDFCFILRGEMNDKKSAGNVTIIKKLDNPPDMGAIKGKLSREEI